MDYFEALKTSPQPSAGPQAHEPLPLPQANDVSSITSFIKHTCSDLYFTSDSDEPVSLYQLSNASLLSLEANASKLQLPSAADFAQLVGGTLTPHDEGFVAEKRPVREFFARLRGQQVGEAQGRLAESLEQAFDKVTAEEAGSSAAYYRVGFPPNIEVYVVMLVDGQAVGIKTLSVET
ncbi:hypothetical protein LPJ53_004547 [Coemansia erecta]|uniref:Uncharacterized protein n=1 Tax=Coemansia erecta TaxID=147472 RepID=A0A9W7XXJ7_9FUNG|nr:hypothetical protein LPJ53_004547 [Coemansia erecta]